MAAKKLKTYFVSRNYIVERQTTVRALNAREAADKLAEFKYDDFTDTTDSTDTGEESIFVDYDSSIARKV